MRAADLFAGAGGCSTGLLAAATARGERVELVAVNHWPIAVETHTKNHPEARHFCAPVETLDPRVAIPSGKLDLLIAAPECTHHSTARGGKPINDQSRASAWHILRWVELLDITNVLIENVPEFQTWGPLGKNQRPLKSRKGETFAAFVNALRSYGYVVEWKVLNAADFGAATTRRRLFIQARKGRTAASWPSPTHSKTGSPTLFGGAKKWRAAREVIDWSLPSQSIFARQRPLRPATMRRILEGLRRYGGPAIQPFLVVLRNHMDGKSIDGPLPSIAASGMHLGVAEPFIVPFLGERDGQDPRTRSVDDPLHTVTSRNPIGLAEPFLVAMEHRGRALSSDAPLPTVTTARGGAFGVVEPFIASYYGEKSSDPRTSSIDEPLPTVPTENRFAVVEPVILGQHGGGVARPVSVPMSTLTADGAAGLVEPVITVNRNNNAPRSIDDPVPPVCTAQHVGLVEPFLTRYYGSGSGLTPASVDNPLDTVTSRDRFGLVQPVIDGYVLDIKFRMLQPHELAGAMSFPRSYVFTGNKGEQIKQIGNAVDCRMAEALCGAILDARGGRKAGRKREVA